MILEDLKHIFKPQLDEITSEEDKLFYILREGNHVTVKSHSANDLENLLTTLDNFHHSGNYKDMPRFTK